MVAGVKVHLISQVCEGVFKRCAPEMWKEMKTLYPWCDLPETADGEQTPETKD